MEKQKVSVAISSAAVSFVLLILKLTVGFITGSIGILSDAVDSGLDLIASIITFFAVRVSKKPADERYHFGYGKIENIAALAETGLLFLTCLWIIYEATHRLIENKVMVEVTWYSFAVMFISITANLSRVRALKKVAKETNSHALEADALNFTADIYASIVVIAGLIFAYFGVKGADAVAAIFVSLIVLYVSFNLGKKSVGVLTDSAPREITEQVKIAILKVEGVIRLNKLRIRPNGFSYFVHSVISVSRKIPLERTNKIIRQIRSEVFKIIPEGDIVVSIKPIALKDETISEQVRIIANNFGVAAHDISIHTINDKKIVSLDMEVPSNLIIKKAHQKASELKELIRKELGQDLEIDIHIEPLEPTELEGKDVNKKTLNLIEKALIKVKKQLPLVESINHVSSRMVGDKIFTAVECIVDEKMPLEKTHDISSRAEYLIREEIPSVERVIVHMEPAKK
jgi:cation diffusion facilitator family transporter